MKTKTIQVSQLHMPLVHKQDEVIRKAAAAAKIPPHAVIDAKILRRSIDARRADDLHYTYRMELTIPAGQHYARSRNVTLSERVSYAPACTGEKMLCQRPVIVGMGPAGLFAGYLLARNGYRPLLIERGKPVEERIRDVNAFWETGVLNTNSNVQFGEGGAGTFSDGKLNTGVKDRFGRNRFVLETFVRFGAPEDILYEARPHIGTDILTKVIAAMREEMKALGAEILFETCLTGIRQTDGILREIRLTGNGLTKEWIPAETCILSIGHSARDTFRMLHAAGLTMEPKAFAVGMRIEHPQDEIDLAQYGICDPMLLARAAYKLTGKTAAGRSAYSFCMCPGGYVVNASSEENRLAVNGMSNRAQDAANANSAIVLSVTPADFADYAEGADDPLCGIRFQEALEEKAFALAGGKIPQQLFDDFKARRRSGSYGAYTSACMGKTAFADLHTLFSADLNDGFIEAVHAFGKKISGFDRPDAILSGVESRTSSPVRIPRDENYQAAVSGLYPCGEGAGYAGGITSAAMDGLRCAEALMREWVPGGQISPL